MGPTHVLKKIEVAVGIACLGMMFVIICLNVFMRYVLTAPIFWAEEVSNFLFVWAGFLSCAYVLAQDQHIRVTLFIGMLRPRTQRWISLAMTVLLTVVFASFVWPSLTALQSLTLTAALQISEAYPYAILPITMILCFTHCVIRIAALVRELASTRREAAS